MEFAFEFENIPEDAFCFIFCGDEILMQEFADGDKILRISDLKALNVKMDFGYEVGLLAGNRCYAVTGNKISHNGFYYKKVRQVYGHIEDSWYGHMLRAFHIISWLKKNRFCGYCGGAMKAFPLELAIQCGECERIVYPRISPAIIVAVIKEAEILLAHSARFPAGRYSVLAGFVEPGETLEDCVRRELKEEVGIGVTDIEYFGSQPWPFPDSLMVAFTAKWSEGEINVDNNEIAAANWYSADNLPDLPPVDSIARRLIDWFVDTQNRARLGQVKRALRK